MKISLFTIFLLSASAACQFVGRGTGSNPSLLVWKYSKRNPD
ncbi:9491_t:CDS:1, partial [Acaulospora morrowiae]